MKGKYWNYLLPVFCCLIFRAHSAEVASEKNAGFSFASPQEAFEDQMAAVNALGDLMFELAAAQHARDTLEDRNIILTTHHGLEIKKFVLSPYTIVSLPFSTPKERSANALFCNQYNSFTSSAIDMRALGGKYSEAMEFYQIVANLHRQIWNAKRWNADDLTVSRNLEANDQKPLSDYEKKIHILNELMQGKDLQANLVKFRELYVGVVSLFNLERARSVVPVNVTNVVEIKLP